MLRRVQTKSDNRIEFVCKVGVVADFEYIDQMRLQSIRAPDALHAGVTQPHLRCERASRPVRRIRRFGVGRSRDDFTNQLRRNSRCAAWAWRIFLEAFQARIQEPLPPASSSAHGSPALP